MYKPSRDSVKLKKLIERRNEAVLANNEILYRQLDSDITKLCDKINGV